MARTRATEAETRMRVDFIEEVGGDRATTTMRKSSLQSQTGESVGKFGVQSLSSWDVPPITCFDCLAIFLLKIK